MAMMRYKDVRPHLKRVHYLSDKQIDKAVKKREKMKYSGAWKIKHGKM